MEYKKQLRNPKWQKKRLEILERDNWQCMSCLGNDITLVVHHKKYISNKMAWEYDNDNLVTLCEDCHKILHDLEKINSNCFFDFLKLSITYTDFFLISKVVALLYKQHGFNTGTKILIQLIRSQTINKDQI